MELHHLHRLQIELHENNEIEAFKEVVRLAYTQLHNAPCVQMHGNPCKKQAGLIGPELFRVKTMLEQLGRSIGVDCPYEPELHPAVSAKTTYPIVEMNHG